MWTWEPDTGQGLAIWGLVDPKLPPLEVPAAFPGLLPWTTLSCDRKLTMLTQIPLSGESAILESHK